MSMTVRRLLHNASAALIAAALVSVVPGLAVAVEFVKSEEVASCELIRHQQCATKRNNAFVRCAEWHERRARQHGATHVVLGRFIEHSSFLFIGNGDQLEAEYFDCRGSDTGYSDGSRRTKAESVVTGSGFFITEQCHFVTNHHVVDGAEHMMLTTHSGDVISMHTVSSDPSNDIAILAGECESKTLPLRASSDALKGQEVFTGSLKAGHTAADGPTLEGRPRRTRGNP